MKEDKKSYLISEVGRMTGVSRSTLYYLHKRGLVVPEQRVNPASKMLDRFYNEDHILRVKFLQLLESRRGIEFLYSLIKRSLEKNKTSREEFDRLIKLKEVTKK